MGWGQLMKDSLLEHHAISAKICKFGNDYSILAVCTEMTSNHMASGYVRMNGAQASSGALKLLW